MISAENIVHTMISIHAPARGATGYSAAFFTILFQFQSTLPRGERRNKMLYCGKQKSFQSTLPRGERLKKHLTPILIVKYFNPRSREGSDVQSRSTLYRRSIFQSTLPRGERRNKMLYCGEQKSFQSTLPRGERLK